MEVAKQGVVNVVNKDSTEGVGSCWQRTVQTPPHLQSSGAGGQKLQQQWCQGGNNMVAWLNRANPSNGTGLLEELGSRHDSTNIAKSVTSTARGHGSGSCIGAGFDCSNHSISGNGAGAMVIITWTRGVATEQGILKKILVWSRGNRGVINWPNWLLKVWHLVVTVRSDVPKVVDGVTVGSKLRKFCLSCRL